MSKNQKNQAAKFVVITLLLNNQMEET